MVQTAHNPILPGFNPDPSIVRVGADYYLATSTFEWFPGVQIHHSRDLVHWRLLTRPLAERRLLDMRGNRSGGGIWAPDLSYADGLFWLVYTDTKNMTYTMDAPNYLTWAEDIEGPWADPVLLNASGFDPSLFHDTDGRKWVVNMLADFRQQGQWSFGGILLQEYDHRQGRLIGERQLIFTGTEHGVTEGPHLYRRGDWYYLWVAEGGTGYNHCETVARAHQIEGPYAVHPDNPLLGALGDRSLALQKAGHASYVETPDGQPYLVHLCGRPHSHPDAPAGRCVLGRETALQNLRWDDDDWPRMAHGSCHPAETATVDLPPHPWEDEETCHRFDTGVVPACFQSLREPIEADWLSFAQRPGCLSLRGRASLSCPFDQSLIARRLDHLPAQVTTVVDCAPCHFQHSAGLVAYYGIDGYSYLALSADDEGRRCLVWITVDPVAKERRFLLGTSGIALPASGPIHLRFECAPRSLRAAWSSNGDYWQDLEPVEDLSILSDECNPWGFTGAMVGMCAQDLDTRRLWAHFASFKYHRLS